MLSKLSSLLIVASLSSLAFSQNPTKPAAPKPNATASQKAAQPAATKSATAPQDPRKKFVLDVVRTAVAIPQSDQQDRLRVLNSAAGVVLPVNKKLAKQFAAEGVQIESELIAAGQTPVVSLLAGGYADCAAAQDFLERIPPDRVGVAEESVIGVITSCPKTLPTAQQRLDAALEKDVVAPRALLAVIERVGSKSAWSQQAFEKMFSSLPSPDGDAARREAPNYATMYDGMAKQVDPDVARSTGLKFLNWLGKVAKSGERNMAVNITTEAMKNALGQKKYDEALATDVVAQQVAKTEGQPGEIETPEEENVSVLQAIDSTGVDRTKQLEKMAPSLRAREAAASGFADGTSGKRKLADRYFDIAFSAADEVWANRAKNANAPAVIEEISEAAAHVNAVDALQRAQKLQDPTAQAIGMLAVARVVAGGAADAEVAGKQ